MAREKIADGIYFTRFNSSYKRNRMSIHLQIPLSRANLTATALLPFVMERGCSLYPDITALKRRLDMLYGSSLSLSASSMDYARMLSLTIEGVDEKYLGEKSIDSSRTDLLLDILFNPVVENNAFKEDWTMIEKEKLRILIMSEINDKRAYCLKKASELFFKDDPRSLPQNGFLEDLDKIGGKPLYEVYKQILCDANVEIVCVGGDEKVKQRLADAFTGRTRNPKPVREKQAVVYGEEKAGEIFFDVEQDKLAMILTAGRLFTEREQSVLRLANLIFGSSPTSRLFMNVREKQSLCYYCTSRPGYMTGALTVDSGIESGNIQKLKTAVLHEIDDMAAGNITDKELDEAKLMLKGALMSVSDTPDGLTGWYLNSIYRLGKSVTPEEEIERIDEVTKQEIASLMSLFKVSVTMHLRKGEHDGIH